MNASPAIRALLPIIVIAFQLGCASPGVETDWDPSISWPMLARYAWLPDPPGQAGDPRFHNSLVDARVRRAVDGQLALQGLVKVSPARADFFVTYYLGLDTRVSVRLIAHSYTRRADGWSDRHRTETRMREHEVGTLLIDLLDRERSLIWRGSTSSRVRSNLSPTQRDERIGAAVQAILDQFPPARDCPSCRR